MQRRGQKKGWAEGQGERNEAQRRQTAVGPFAHSRFRVVHAQAVKLLPHPQPPVEFGLLKVKPEPCIEVT